MLRKKTVLGILIIFLCYSSVYAKETIEISEHKLKQMIGQMLIIGFDERVIDDNSLVARAIQTYTIGGVILFDRFYNNKDKIKNIESPKQLQQLILKLQSYSTNKLIVSIDQEGGNVQRLKSRDGFSSTPSAKEIAKMSDKEAKEVYTKLAETLHQNGINCNFAPVLDLSIDKNNYVIEGLERSYGTTPEVVTRYAAIFSDALQSKNIISVLKHFPGHGSSKEDSHQGFVDVSNTWHEIELEPYKNLIKSSKANMIMTAHVFNKHLDENYPATLSYEINTKLLREKLNFKGIIISDDLQMKAIKEHYSLKETVTLAINAGVDILLFGNQLAVQDIDTLINTLYEEVKNGAIPYKRIVESNKRIAALKSKL